MKKKLPVGIEGFHDMRKEDFYYVDKTGFIRELLGSWGKVNLFTRPRRFGKSLNMNMLHSFFDYHCDSRLFEGLEIDKERDYCEKYQGKFPVVFITLKDVCGRSYQEALEMLRTVIGREAMRFQFLLESVRLSGADKALYRQLIEIDVSNRQSFAMPDDALINSLLILSDLLKKHYGQKVILLIDEYDVPLDKARQAGYYGEMIYLIRSLLARCLKGNGALHFAVLTGCLRVSKESVFTGLNNLSIFSVTDTRFSQYFGFTDEEVRTLLGEYELEPYYDVIKKWYDGYRFGRQEIYCPWDVINYASLLLSEPEARPRAFWINTSGNDIIREFIRMAKPQTRQELERLVNGESITRKINQELTYRDLYRSIDNLWSVLFTTGYLTQRGNPEEDVYQLAIPNLEIRKIFAQQILEWFEEEVQKDIPALDAFCAAFVKGDAETAQRLFNAYLMKTISIRDTNVRKDRKENFYHGILLGLLSHQEEKYDGFWSIESNAESGEGYSDILVEVPGEGIGIVIEVKYADSGDLEKECQKALGQIERTGYETRLRLDGMGTIRKYGIACHKKRCRISMADSVPTNGNIIDRKKYH